MMRVRKVKQFFLLPAVSMLAACASLTPIPNVDVATAIQSGNYQLDPDHASLTFEISHFGISNYLGRFNQIEALLDIDENAPETAQLRFTADINSLDINNDSFRKTLIGPEWFNAEDYPKAVFISEFIQRQGSTEGLVSGQLTLKGVTKPVTLNVKFNGGLKNPLSRKQTLGFEATGEIKRSDFGIDKFLFIAGNKFDFDTVKLRFNGEFKKN